MKYWEEGVPSTVDVQYAENELTYWERGHPLEETGSYSAVPSYEGQLVVESLLEFSVKPVFSYIGDLVIFSSCCSSWAISYTGLFSIEYIVLTSSYTWGIYVGNPMVNMALNSSWFATGYSYTGDIVAEFIVSHSVAVVSIYTGLYLVEALLSPTFRMLISYFGLVGVDYILLTSSYVLFIPPNELLMISLLESDVQATLKVYRLSGYVKKSGEGVLGATVRCFNQNSNIYVGHKSSDSNGYFEFNSDEFQGLTSLNKYHLFVEYEDVDKYNAKSLWDISPVTEIVNK